MNRRMDEWVIEWKQEQTDERMDQWMNGQVGGWMVNCVKTSIKPDFVNNSLQIFVPTTRL